MLSIMFPIFEGTFSMVTKKEREAAELAETERLAAEAAETPVATETETEAPLADQVVHLGPAVEPTPDAEEQELLAIQDPASLFADVTSHIAEDAPRKQFPIRLPYLDDVAKFRDPRFMGFGTLWAVQDTSGDWCPDYTSLQGYAAVSGEHCCTPGIHKGLAVTLTSGNPTTTQAGKRITLGGGIRPTNEAMILFFGCNEETVKDFIAAGVPHATLMADLKAKLNRGRDDRKRREANRSRQTASKGGQQQGRRPEVDYKEDEADTGKNWGF